MMKLLAASAALFAFAAIDAAGAADMAVKAPPAPVVAPYNWTGAYIGLNAGYGWGSDPVQFTSTRLLPPQSVSANMNGVFGGGQIGYNWQNSSRFIFGLEADIQAIGQHASQTLPTITLGLIPFAPGSITSANLAEKLPWFGTARLRLGYEPADRWMLYVTGGLAYGEVDTTANAAFTTNVPGPAITTTATSAAARNTRTGWTIGAGSEWMISDSWSGKIEYLYMDLGKFTDTFAGPGFTMTTSSHLTDNLLRVGLNYHFGR
jgi:outer membrane immunogenic protein